MKYLTKDANMFERQIYHLEELLNSICHDIFVEKKKRIQKEKKYKR